MTTNTPAKKVFQVSQQVRVRSDTSTKSTSIRWLNVGERLQVDTASRKEAEGIVWWKHSEGWTAERKLDNSDVYLLEVVDTPAVTTSAPSTTTPAPTTTTPAQPAAKKGFKVGNTNVRIRTDPSAKARLIREMLPGEVIEVDPASRTEADGFVWWKHSQGWSVERKLNGSEVYLVDPATVITPPASTSSAPTTSVMGADGLPDVTKLPLVNLLFTRSPVAVEQTDWTQYFGNTQYAFENGVRWSYDKFAQGLHSGLDYGTNNQAGLPIFAGTQGTFMRQDRYGLHIKVADYHIIYQHIADAAPFAANAPISPDTQIGMMERLSGNVHLHLEVRYKEKWIINPLVFLPEAARNTLMAKFKNFERYFCKTNGWTQWQTPLDQPVIVLGGPPIGPTAKR